MEKTSKELLKEFVNSQHFTSTTDIMNSMKELFSDCYLTSKTQKIKYPEKNRKIIKKAPNLA